jgi:hypothetical protein
LHDRPNSEAKHVSLCLPPVTVVSGPIGLKILSSSMRLESRGLAANAINQQKVRISGWLMLDPEHKDMIDEGLRSTLWEIHPITKIEVWSNGAWVDLDNP